MTAGIDCASSITSAGKRLGRWCLRMMISTSMPKSSGDAKNFNDAADRRPFAVAVFENLGVDDHAVELADIGDFDRLRARCGQPGCARSGRSGMAMSSGISIHSVRRSSCGTTNRPRRLMRNWPTTVGCARLRILTISPSVRPFGPVCVMRAMARSPFIAPARAVAADIEIAGDTGYRVIGNQKSVAVAMNADAPGDEFAAARRGDVMPVGELDQIAAGSQAVEGGFDRLRAPRP